MPVDELVAFARQGLLLAVALSLPVLAATALASLVVAVLQSAIHAADSTIAHVPRLLVVVAVLTVAGRWMGSELVAFAARAFALGS